MARDIRTRVSMWNLVDEVLAQRGDIASGEVRSCELEEAIVDTGSTRLVLSWGLVDGLGLLPVGRVTVRYADDRRASKEVAGGVVVEIMGRRTTLDAIVDEWGEPLIGMEVLEALDLWPDPQLGTLTTNPASPDVPLYNLLRVTSCPLP